MAKGYTPAEEPNADLLGVTDEDVALHPSDDGLAVDETPPWATFLLEGDHAAATAPTPPADMAAFMARAKQQGFVTTEQILQVQPAPEMHIAEVDEIYAELLELNIEIVDDSEWPAATAPAPEPPAAVMIDLSADLDGVGADDPVRLYLREIGRVPLLTADAEIALAKRMERGVFLEQLIAGLSSRGLGPTASIPGAMICRQVYNQLRRAVAAGRRSLLRAVRRLAAAHAPRAAHRA